MASALSKSAAAPSRSNPCARMAPRSAMAPDVVGLVGDQLRHHLLEPAIALRHVLRRDLPRARRALRRLDHRVAAGEARHVGLLRGDLRRGDLDRNLRQVVDDADLVALAGHVPLDLLAGDLAGEILQPRHGVAFAAVGQDDRDFFAQAERATDLDRNLAPCGPRSVGRERATGAREQRRVRRARPRAATGRTRRRSA